MKSLLLGRHAKSSWDFSVEDFDRPLNERGHKNAAEMAKRLLKKGVELDLIISSPANRAITTAGYFAEAYDIKKKKILTIPSLYEAGLEIFYSVIEEIEDEHSTVAIFSHNPGITQAANSFTTKRIDDMPTCSIFAVKANIQNWKDFRKAQKEYWFFDYPKA